MCVHMCMCVCVYACVLVFVCVHICICTHCMCMCVCTYVYLQNRRLSPVKSRTASKSWAEESVESVLGTRCLGSMALREHVRTIDSSEMSSPALVVAPPSQATCRGGGLIVMRD